MMNEKNDGIAMTRLKKKKERKKDAHFFIPELVKETY